MKEEIIKIKRAIITLSQCVDLLEHAVIYKEYTPKALRKRETLIKEILD